jgi:hypothetical protein
MTRCLILFLVLIVASFGCFFDNAIAGESTSIRLSCIIPAVPGVNVPLVKENASSATETKNIEKQTNLYSQVMFQKETQETRNTEGQKLLVKVETIYSR